MLGRPRTSEAQKGPAGERGEIPVGHTVVLASGSRRRARSHRFQGMDNAHQYYDSADAEPQCALTVARDRLLRITRLGYRQRDSW